MEHTEIHSRGGLEPVGAEVAGVGAGAAEPPRGRVLAVCTVDVMAAVLLRPWFEALGQAGWEVHVACSRSSYFESLEAAGFHMHEVALQRRFHPLVHLRPLVELYRLMRREGFAIVNTHSPVAAAVGRVAAWLARAPHVIYTVHGFYFHDRMRTAARRLFVALEWLLGRMTHQFMFVSEEDRQTALRTGIAGSAAATRTIYNGVNLERYAPAEASGEGDGGEREAVRRGLRIALEARVVGIVGRLVREKGYREFVGMAARVLEHHPEAVFLVVGDNLASDRDQFAGRLRAGIRERGLEGSFRFTGFTTRIPELLRVMDVFVLPSYREGFPRSVLEAMACGLPVVATDIRGSREAVVDGSTGRIVAVGDDQALAAAVLEMLDDPEKMRRMGSAGRERARRLYDERLVQRRFVEIFEALEWGGPHTSTLAQVVRRGLDIAVAGLGLVALAPVLGAVAVAVALFLGRPVVFRQRRTGLGGRLFTLYKFRTMADLHGASGELLDDERRLTRLGRWLRANSLDELPQLWNVLKGDMSLVGPRPLLPQYLSRYTATQTRRHLVRPGITGWAQVNGRNGIGWERKFELDTWYVDHRSLWLDLKILARTVVEAVRRAGISEAGNATMSEFLGAAPAPTGRASRPVVPPAAAVAAADVARGAAAGMGEAAGAEREEEEEDAAVAAAVEKS